MPVLVVDVANVMGSRPDGWWRDRAGAATRLMASLVPLVESGVIAPAGAGFEPAGFGSGAGVEPGVGAEPEVGVDPGAGAERGASAGPSVRIGRIVAVIEGRARSAVDPPGIEVVRAPADGDSTIVEVAAAVLAGGEVPLVVTADRGLRARLPAGALFTGPGWLLALL